MVTGIVRWGHVSSFVRRDEQRLYLRIHHCDASTGSGVNGGWGY